MIPAPLRILATNAPFRRFWLGFTFSVLGDSFTRVAFIWFVYETTGSAAAVGLLMVFYTGPLIVGGFLAGWALDRFDRRAVMFLDNLVRGLAIAIVPLLYLLDSLALWHVYLAAAVYGLLMMVALAGAPSLIPALVRPHELNAANGLESLSYTVGGVIGPAVAGLLIAAVGAPLVVVIDVLSYLALAAVVATLPAHDMKGQSTGRSGGFGPVFRLLFANPILLSTTLMFATFNIGLGFMNVWLPILSDRTLGGGAELFGFLLAAMAFGETVSSLLAGSSGAGRLGQRICWAQTVSGLSLGLLFLVPTIPVAVVAMTLLGLASAPMTIWAQTLRMRIIPPAQHGRAFALLRLIMQAGAPVGSAIAGFVLPVAGMAAAIAASAAAIGLPGIAGFGIRGLRKAEA
jgi:MFS family permease